MGLAELSRRSSSQDEGMQMFDALPGRTSGTVICAGNSHADHRCQDDQLPITSPLV
jgi:hypothetical protein